MTLSLMVEFDTERVPRFPRPAPPPSPMWSKKVSPVATCSELQTGGRAFHLGKAIGHVAGDCRV